MDIKTNGQAIRKVLLVALKWLIMLRLAKTRGMSTPHAKRNVTIIDNRGG